jgi:esterase/lipase superfamily enzyme
VIDARDLSGAIANSWDRMTPLLGADREPFERELITLLRQLDGARDTDVATTIGLILALFDKVSGARDLLIQGLNRLAPSQKGVGERDGSPLFVQMERYTTVPVFYGSDRAMTGTAGATIAYGAARGSLSYGVAEVSIPDDHRMGKVERPNLWRLQFKEDPTRHVVVLKLEPLSEAAFTDRARSAIDQTDENDVLLFVHGYNVGFDDALMRTAQIAYDLKFYGVPALYSWPSEAAFPKYIVDETNVNWSRPHFAIFLKLLTSSLGAKTVHIIAHSMGSRLVAETIAAMTQPLSLADRYLRQVVFAAPDIDADTFKDLAQAFPGKAERYTLYASSKDKALLASRNVHQYARAGESGVGLVVVDSVDTVDATAVDTSMVGHAYYGENRSVLADVFRLIQGGTPPNARIGLKSRTQYGVPYWVFSP